jgi:hypothetical protein
MLRTWALEILWERAREEKRKGHGKRRWYQRRDIPWEIDAANSSPKLVAPSPWSADSPKEQWREIWVI